MTLSTFCTLAAFVLSEDSGTAPVWNYTIGLVLNLVAAAALVWRHEHPWPVLAVAVAGPLVFSTDATAALIALYAVAKIEHSRRLVAAVGAVYAACVVSLLYDAGRTRDNSVLSMEQKPEPGQPKPVWEIDWWLPCWWPRCSSAASWRWRWSNAPAASSAPPSTAEMRPPNRPGRCATR